MIQQKKHWSHLRKEIAVLAMPQIGQVIESSINIVEWINGQNLSGPSVSSFIKQIGLNALYSSLQLNFLLSNILPWKI